MMQYDKFTALGRNAIGAAQSAALAANHQKLMAEHILAALLKDNNMTVKMLLSKAGGDSAALSAHLKTALDKVPQVTGGGAGQLFVFTDTAHPAAWLGRGDVRHGRGVQEDRPVAEV